MSTQQMLIPISNPSTKLNDVYTMLWKVCNDKGEFHFSSERNGHVVCQGRLCGYSARTFAPVVSSEGDAFMNAEILCMVELLKMNGVEVAFAGDNQSEAKPKAVKSKLSKNDLKNASSLKDCLRRLEDSGYDMSQITDRLDKLRLEGRRVNKYDILDFVFKEVVVVPITERKPLRSGAEWMRVKQLMEGRNLPDGYKNADDFATFASKDEIDGIEHENN